ncbi:MAG: methylmalonyl-CoA carboxyltransferase [Deltaproteobacteria bacterium]|nr:methylmalonyl-CoA carboxyltransferase [Deltaproteobacteria bacterium]
MKSVKERLGDLGEREAAEQAMGGEKAVAKQHEGGKLTARERLAKLFDPGSFTETDLFVHHRCHDFGLGGKPIPGDGVVCGYGRVDGRRVFAYAQDFTARAGTMGEMQSKKICRLMDLAIKTGAPIVGLNDSGGARIQEGVDALSGYGQIFFRNSIASGVVPQISGIMGPTAGGAVYSPAMTDFVFMVQNSSYMFITGPQVIKAVTGEEVSAEDLGGAMTHCTRSGCAHFACADDADCIARIRELLAYLPSNNLQDPPVVQSADDPARLAPELDSLVPDDARQSYDMREVIRAIADDGEIVEPHALYATNILVAFIRLAGSTVGVIANQPAVMAGALDVNASDKATRFIRFCDAFHIPLLTLTDVPGYLPGIDQEHSGIIRHGAKLLWCYSEATVPKVTLVTRKAYGGSYLAMCSSDLGADIVFAWPTAEIAVMGAEGASRIIFRKEIAEAEDKEAKFAEKVAEYEELFANPYKAAERGYITGVIRPRESRPRIIEAFAMLRDKRELRPARKHGNIPV